MKIGQLCVYVEGAEPFPTGVQEIIGEYALPKPVVLSPHDVDRVRADLGVNVSLVGAHLLHFSCHEHMLVKV